MESWIAPPRVFGGFNTSPYQYFQHDLLVSMTRLILQLFITFSMPCPPARAN
jgi:hypothetical protein